MVNYCGQRLSCSIYDRVHALRSDSTRIPCRALDDEIEIEDMDFDESKGIYTYPCPCGDKFQISLVSGCRFNDYSTVSPYFFVGN